MAVTTSSPIPPPPPPPPLLPTSAISSLFFFIFLLLLHASAVSSIRVDVIRKSTTPAAVPVFREAPAFRNADDCPPGARVNVAMTLDANYLRGTMAAVLSILQHTSCPESVAFHFLAAKLESEILAGSIRSTFPYLDFKVHRFHSGRVRGRISRSIRQALDQPLNYARIYLADLLPPDVDRVIYLDSDVVVVDDIGRLWEVELGVDDVVAAPEYCHANFTKYFTNAFWSDPTLAGTFEKGSTSRHRRRRPPCYFNTGVMVMDVEKWREGGYTKKVEYWMGVQKKKRIYQLGSLPPFLLVLAGNIKGVDHRWNQHGLGGDNIEGRCRDLHPGPVSLLHWSGKGKPWLRLDSRKPCAVDHLWAPYDLYRSSSLTSLEE